jgi:hypothetical protein
MRLKIARIECFAADENQQTASLTKKEKKLNRALAGKRVKVGNVIRRPNVFCVLSER